MSQKLGRRARQRMQAQDPSHLPQTYPDYVARVRPHVVRDVERMAAECDRRGIPGTFSSLDEVPCYDRDATFMREIENQADCSSTFMRRHGLTRDQFIQGTLARPRIVKQLAYMVETDTAMLLRFRMAGEPVFRISAGLAQRLSETRMNVPTERMRLPFPTVNLVFDDDVTSDALGRLQKGGVVAESRPVNVIVSEFDDERGRRWHFNSTRTQGTRAHFMAIRSVALDTGGDAEQALHTDWEQREGRGEDPLLREITGKPVVDRVHYEEGIDFYRIVVNALLYITSHRPDLTERTRTEGEKGGPRAPVRYIVAGEGMTPIDDRGHGTGQPRAGRRTPVRLHRVRGHWKDQRSGPGGTARAHIFVDPYIRGADADLMVSKPYDVR